LSRGCWRRAASCRRRRGSCPASASPCARPGRQAAAQHSSKAEPDQADSLACHILPRRWVIGVDNMMWGSDYPRSESTFADRFGGRLFAGRRG
jgi:hypothetical protein